MVTSLVTGATGMVGSHLAERLAQRGDRVVALVRPASSTAHLDRIGVKLTDLSSDQAEYIGVTPEGPFKPEHYRY